MAGVLSSETLVLQAVASHWMQEYAPRGIFTTDTDFIICSWNVWLQNHTGRTAEEVVGHNLFQVFPEFLDRGIQPYYEEALNGQVRLLSQRFHKFLLPLPSDTAAEHMRQTVQITPLLHEGTIVGTLTFVEDVSERLLEEAELQAQITRVQESETRLRQQLQLTEAITNNASTGLFIMDHRQHCVFMNPAAERLTGYTLAETSGRPLHDVIHHTRPDGSPYPLLECPIDSAFPERSRVQGEDTFVHKDGTFYPVAFTASPVYSEGTVVGTVIEALDIRERKRSEQEREELLAREQRARREAEKANRLKDDFLATVSHELRTPLTAILGWAHMLMRGNLDESTQMRAIKTIERNANMQQQLIEDLLDVTRIISGKMTLAVRPVSLRSAIQGAIDSLQLAADAKDIRIVAIFDESVQIVSDPDRLQQVIWNLISNGVKFTPRGGRVEIRVEHFPEHSEITVADNGPGIKPEVLPYVFDRFRQADSSATRAASGLGLGLAIVRHLVELHGGTVHADNAPEGGAIFIVKLPRTPMQNGNSPDELGGGVGPDVEQPPVLGGLHVLVVDNEEDTRVLLRSILEANKARVTTVDSAAEALMVVEQDHPDVLVVDIGMPGEDGYSLISRVRNLPVECGGLIPALALTAYAREEDRQEALMRGFQTHVSKPVTPTTLVAVIASLAGRIRGLTRV